MNVKLILRLGLCAAWVLVGPLLAKSQEGKVLDESGRIPVIKEKVVIDTVWSGHPVGFFLKTEGDRQYIAYYNAERRMVVGMRLLSEKSFATAIVPSASEQPPSYKCPVSSTILGWDSHNYITLKVDRVGFIHLAGNMHANKLTYLRSVKPYDSTRFERVDFMVGKNEDRCTYPKFMDGPEGELIFHYRDGGSGNGNEIYNVYDEKTGTWRRLLDTPLADGQGKMNAYILGPVRGPDGTYHVSWVWRDTPDCATNHDLSYARSKDLVNWESAAGKSIALPMTLEMQELIVDPIPIKGGIINGSGKIGFDAEGNCVLAYHKFDEKGKTQIYTARFEEGGWAIRKVSDWNYRWYFSGGGSIDVDVGASEVSSHEKGLLALDYRNKKESSGTWLFDSKSLARVGRLIRPRPFPGELLTVESDFKGMGVRWKRDAGKADNTDDHYVLRWETLGRNRDRPRTGPLPAVSELVLYRVGYSSKAEGDANECH